jgi:hypothetical protein
MLSTTAVDVLVATNTGLDTEPSVVGSVIVADPATVLDKK